MKERINMMENATTGMDPKQGMRERIGMVEKAWPGMDPK